MKRLLTIVVVLLAVLGVAFATGTIGGQRQSISDLEREIAEETSGQVTCQEEEDSGRVGCFGTVDSRPAFFVAERAGDEFKWRQTP